MRSIIWIGCIFSILIAMLSIGVLAETETTAMVQIEAPADTVAVTQDEILMNVSPVTAEEETTEAEILVPADTVISESAEPDMNETESVIVEQVIEEPELINDVLVPFVKNAKNYALNAGRPNAITAFNDNLGDFADPNMAIFAYDYSGKVLALPLDVSKVGVNQLSLADPSGIRYIEQMRNAAQEGEGFVTFMAPNLKEQNVVMEKTAYILDVDGNYWIGAAVFTPVIQPVTEISQFESADETVESTA